MSDSHTENGRAPGMCPCSYTDVRRASRKRAPFLCSASTSSPWISMYALSGWGLKAVVGCRFSVVGCCLIGFFGVAGGRLGVVAPLFFGGGRFRRGARGGGGGRHRGAGRGPRGPNHARRAPTKPPPPPQKPGGPKATRGLPKKILGRAQTGETNGRNLRGPATPRRATREGTARPPRPLGRSGTGSFVSSTFIHRPPNEAAGSLNAIGSLCALKRM